MGDVPGDVTLVEVARDDDAGLRELFEFADLHGRPRTTDPAVYRDLMAPCASWRCVVARRAGDVVAATLASINEVLGLDQVQLNAFFAPGHEDAFAAVLDDAGCWGRELGATIAMAHVSEPSDEAVAAWKQAGFEHVGDRARVARTVSAQDAQLAPVSLDGVRIVALADRPELEAAADDIWKAGHADIPSALAFADGALPGFRTELDLADDDPIPGSLLLALEGDDVVGLAVLMQLQSTPGVGGHRFTTVGLEAFLRRPDERVAAQAVVDAIVASGLLQVDLPPLDWKNPEVGRSRLYLDRRARFLEFDTATPPAVVQPILDALAAYELVVR